MVHCCSKAFPLEVEERWNNSCSCLWGIYNFRWMQGRHNHNPIWTLESELLWDQGEQILLCRPLESCLVHSNHRYLKQDSPCPRNHIHSPDMWWMRSDLTCFSLHYFCKCKLKSKYINGAWEQGYTVPHFQKTMVHTLCVWVIDDMLTIRKVLDCTYQKLYTG